MRAEGRTGVWKSSSSQTYNVDYMIYGYVRVSTKEQMLDLQLDYLKKSGCDVIVEEKISAKKKRRELYNILNNLQEGDVIKVWKLDRLVRSLKELIHISEIIRDKKANLLSLTENIDTSSPAGLTYFYCIGMFAELERNLIVERTKAGLRAAVERGVKLGRKPSEELKKTKRKARALYKKNYSVQQIADMFHVSVPTVYRYLNMRKFTRTKHI